jgi:hypothetical protein
LEKLDTGIAAITLEHAILDLLLQSRELQNREGRTGVKTGVKRAAKVVIGAVLVCLVATAVINQTGFGQGGPNELCPMLRTDPFGFPLNPPYSEYPTGGVGDITVGTFPTPISVLKEDLPCCGVIDANGNLVLVPADGVLERCIIPSVQVFPGETCPAIVDIVVTIEDGTGAVRNCLEFNPGPDFGGGSNFTLTGTNAN